MFDLDGTLLNRDVSLERFINNQYERLHAWLGFIPKENYTSRFIALDSRGYVWKDQVYQQLIKEFDIKGITKEALVEDYLNNFKFHCVSFQNLIAMLEDLKNNNYKLAIISNGRGQFQMDNIEALGIKDYFEEILISEWEEVKKPNPNIFLKALEKMKTLPGEAIFVGDHPFNDIRAAKEVGMKGIWMRDKFWSEVDSDYVVNDLFEIPLIIEMLNKGYGENEMID